MYIESVSNRNSPPAVLLRESYRDAGKVKKRTLANLTKWPPALVQGLRTLLKGGVAVARLADAFDIVRSLPHGHVAAVLGTLRKLRLERTLAPEHCAQRDRVLAMIVARILNPGSKLATARGLMPETARDSLAETLALDHCDEDDLYAAMNWLLERQDAIERRLAKHHLDDGALVLYDLTSVYLEGRCCPLAKHGHSRDAKRGKLQIDKLRRRFGLSRVVLVGDRGMLTEARIRDEVEPAGLDWISALRGSAVRALVESGSVQLSLFDQTDLVEIRSPEYPGERLMVCRNPLLAEERKRKREALLRATEALLDPIVAATQRDQRRLKGKEKIALRVGGVIGKYKMAKHFSLAITEESFGYRRNPESIARETALDGLYIVRTSLPASELDAQGTVCAYKSLSQVERAFRSFKTVDLKVRPIFHYAPDRVRAHVLLCMLAYYVEWHMRQSLAPLLFDDDDRAGAEAARASVVAPARVSLSAQDKARSKRTAAGWPTHSFRTLLDDLATIARNRIVPRLPGAEPFDVLTRPTALQRETFRLLGIRLESTQ